MSLATRCTACGTVFRVVQDQLKVSEGWVRCGRCSEVFNALEGLFDLDRDTPPDGSTGAIAAVGVPSPDADVAVPVDADEGAPGTDTHSLTDKLDKIDAQLLGPRDAGHESTPATRISERDRLEFPDAQFDPDMLAEETVQRPMPIEAAPSSDPAGAGPDQPAAAAPEFIRHAQRQARWQSPRMRALQAGAATLLLVALALQGLHHFRDVIAARWPDVAPALTAWCDAVSCAIDAPRRIEDVVVESTTLTRASAPDAFKLSVVLRSRATMIVALPSIDLSLTDADGQLVARRMLAPRDFLAASAPMKPGTDTALQLVLTTGNARVAGYTVEVFYP